MSKYLIAVVLVLIGLGVWLGIKASGDPEVSPTPSVSQSPSSSPVGSAGETPDEFRDGK